MQPVVQYDALQIILVISFWLTYEHVLSIVFISFVERSSVAPFTNMV